jgi:hypothetical protein|tara:strand:+ start:118 stop:294 length:177 start_codon:yes stop_codon:yes gene_type:complete
MHSIYHDAIIVAISYIVSSVCRKNEKKISAAGPSLIEVKKHQAFPVSSLEVVYLKLKM